MSRPNPDQVRRHANAVLSGLFILLIWLPTLDVCFKWDQTSQVQENRVLAAFPKFTPGLAGIRQYVHSLELYYNDHFGFRRWLIYQGEQWKRKWFKPGKEYDVIIGREGWLYQANPVERPAHDEKAPFTAGELRDWKALLEKRRDWLARRGIHYIFLVAPTKQTIYPEYLPEGAASGKHPTKTDQFFEFMRANSSVEMVDLRPILWKAKEEERVYFRTDSHWNQYGGFLACQELVRGLSRQMTELEPLPTDAFERKLVSGKGGNLALMLMAMESMPETDFPSLSPRPPLEPLVVTDGAANYMQFIVCKNPKRTGTAVIFGDSFVQGWFPFVGYHFNQVSFYRLYDELDLHYWDPALIEREKPTVVIDEILEAFLAQEDAAKISAKDGLK